MKFLNAKITSLVNILFNLLSLILGNLLGGTASYMLGMSSTIAAQAEGGNTPSNVKNLSIGWMIGFLFVVSFVGLFSIVPLRKVSTRNVYDFSFLNRFFVKSLMCLLPL